MNKKLRKISRLFCITFSVGVFLVGTGRARQPNLSLPINDGKQNTVPRLEPSTCPVPVPKSVKAECINLFVKENRSKIDSRTIKLPVIIIKSTSENPATDPVLYTGGGPGAGSLGRARRADNLVPFTKERDFIIFEQRGTQYAEPSLQCPEVNAANHSSAEQNLSAKKARQNEVRAAKVCYDRLTREGVDLSAYNSAASAVDIEDLRRLLKIKQLNLYGISYSTRLMLNYIREYPNNVRSVILDSVLPPTANWDETDVDNIINSLNLVFLNCKRAAKCSAAYPELEKTFYLLLQTANKNPIAVDVAKNDKIYRIKLDGNAIFDFVYNLLEDTSALPKIPSIIFALNKGNYEALKPYAENMISGGGFIWGMRYSVWCSEEMPFQDRRKIAEQATKHPGIRGFKVQGAFPDICKIWKATAAGEIENQPIKSNIPALIFSGEFDPDTPPAWGRLVASWFPNSFFYEVKNTSHGAINNRCTFVDITSVFIKNPTSKPDDSCLSSIPPIDFQ